MNNPEQQQHLDRPLFVSIGDTTKLQKFLELNPAVPRDRTFVDDYTKLEAYKSLGFPNFTELKAVNAKGMKLRFPTLSFTDTWKYMTNVASMSPVDAASSKSGIPEGVLKTGGTFVIQGDEVIYQWFDKIPGDHPDPIDVIAVVKQAQNM
jgi:AhpC/TSA antioxidant enzyme